MSFITESKLKSYKRSSGPSYFSTNESLRGFRNESKAYKTKIFLSHKHDELEQLESAISFLKDHGVDIYVDWLDEEMPKHTNGITAQRIKEKIKENHKFILLATEEAISSKWCNWELGLGDAEKYIDNIALLPVENDYSAFSGSEYLQIYPYIVYRDGTTKYSDGRYIPKGYYVRFPSEGNSYTIINLKKWLNRL